MDHPPDLLSSDEEREENQPLHHPAPPAAAAAAAPKLAVPAPPAPANQQNPPANDPMAAVAQDEAVAAALAAEDADGDEGGEIRIGKSFRWAFPAFLAGHIVLHLTDRIKTEVQLHQYASTMDAVKAIWEQKRWPGFFEGFLPAITEGVVKVFLRMYTHSIVTEWIRNQFYHGDRNSKLHPMHMVVSSAVAATAESIFLATPLQLLKLRHMNTPVYVAFRTILYECLFEKPPTVLYHGFWVTFARQLINHVAWWILWEGSFVIPGIAALHNNYYQEFIVTALAGLVMTAITNPIEVLKTNVQASFAAPPTREIAKQLHHQGRWWSGLALRLFASPISQASAYFLVECTRSFRPQGNNLPVQAPPQQDPH